MGGVEAKMPRAAVFEELLRRGVCDVERISPELLASLRRDASGLRGQTYAQMLRRPEVTMEAVVASLVPAMQSRPELATWVEPWRHGTRASVGAERDEDGGDGDQVCRLSRTAEAFDGAAEAGRGAA